MLRMTTARALCLSYFLLYGVAGLGMLPALVKRLEDSFDLSHQQMGFVLGGGMAPLAIGTFIGGVLFDRLGGRMAMSCSMALCIAVAIVIAGAQTAPTFVVSMLLLFAAYGVGNAANPLVARLYNSDQDAGLNLADGVSGAGKLCAPLVVAACLWATGGWRASFGVTAVLLGLLLVMFLWKFERTPAGSVSSPSPAEPVREPADPQAPGPGVVLGLIGFIFTAGSETALIWWMPTFLETEAHFSTTTALYALTFLMGGYTFVRILTAVSTRITPGRLIPASLPVYLLCFYLMTHTQDVRMLYPVSFVLGICLGPGWPSLAGAVYRRSPKAHGWLTTVFVLASTIGSAVFIAGTGWLGDHVGLRQSMMLAPACGIVFVVIYVIFLRQERAGAVASG